MIYDTRSMGVANSSSIWRTTALGLTVAFCALRLAHVHLLWADEDYHLAAALQILHGKLPYRDFIYDKPPLAAFYYVLVGGRSGWPLRLLDATYILLACRFTYRLARELWGEAEGRTAAFLLAFYTAFYLPAAVIPFAPDALMLVPHLGSMLYAARKLPVRAGLWVGVALLVNTKAVFVGATALIWLWPAAIPLVVGSLVPVAAAALAAFAMGAWPAYLDQVWHWGLLYANAAPVARPVWNGIVRTSDWLLFHAALMSGAAVSLSRSPRGERFRLAAWLLLSFAAVCLGLRFVPRYFFQLLPPAVIVASRGIVLVVNARRRFAAATLVVLLAIPLLRFGPRYVSLAYDNLAGRAPQWSDIALDLDSHAVASRLHPLTRPADTLFVWGYRPDIYVYTRLTAPGRFWDSQPLTGVPADRHLSSIAAIDPSAAAANRLELARTSPDWIVDGLSLLNPRLAPAAYPELQPWLARYRLFARTKFCLIYRKTP